MTITIVRTPAGAGQAPDPEQEAALAGWYPALDPWRDRYWNGSAWTERYRDRGTPTELPSQPSPSGRLRAEPRRGVGASILALSTAAAMVVGVVLGGATGIAGLARAAADVAAAEARTAQAEHRADALQERLDALEESLRAKQ